MSGGPLDISLRIKRLPQSTPGSPPWAKVYVDDAEAFSGAEIACRIYVDGFKAGRERMNDVLAAALKAAKTREPA